MLKKKKRTTAAANLSQLCVYNRFTGEFKPFNDDKEALSYFAKWEKPNTGGFSLDMLLVHAKRCKCKCVGTLSFAAFEGYRNKNDKPTVLDDFKTANEMFHYLTVNYAQHYGEFYCIIHDLEQVYSQNDQLKMGHFNFDDDSVFCQLLIRLVSESPCFRRYLANNAKGYTLLKVTEICLSIDAKDVNYSNMMVSIGDSGFYLKMMNAIKERLHFIYKQLKINPSFRINCLLNYEQQMTLRYYRGLWNDQHIPSFFMYDRYAYLPLSMKCKRLFLIAKFKPNESCCMSTLPLDILKYIIEIIEVKGSLPDAKGYKVMSFNQTFKKPTVAKKSCALM